MSISAKFLSGSFFITIYYGFIQKVFYPFTSLNDLFIVDYKWRSYPESVFAKKEVIKYKSVSRGI